MRLPATGSIEALGCRTGWWGALEVWGEGLTEEVGLVGGAEAEGGNGLLMGPDDPTAEASTHMQQPDLAPEACSRQHVPALLVACLCDHRQGCPSHGEELLGGGGVEQSLRGRAICVHMHTGSNLGNRPSIKEKVT